jgi:hypothetical protein
VGLDVSPSKTRSNKSTVAGLLYVVEAPDEPAVCISKVMRKSKWGTLIFIASEEITSAASAAKSRTGASRLRGSFELSKYLSGLPS